MAAVSVIILTRDERANLPFALESVRGWAADTFVVDSFSTDGTPEIARDGGATVVQHEFTGYGGQRNWALAHLPLKTEWVLFLDADEMLSPALRREIDDLDLDATDARAFSMRFRFVFMGRWLRHGGYYGTRIVRLMRRDARWDERAVDEKVVSSGRVVALQGDLIHCNRKGLSAWVAKHNHYADLEADEMANARRTARGRRRVWASLPLVVRAFLYFGYRYVVRLGFLDGRPGLVFHALHALWYRVLVDAKYLERT